nr:uncharacterized protein [Candidatus Cloacimonadota bacterium]
MNPAQTGKIIVNLLQILLFGICGIILASCAANIRSEHTIATLDQALYQKDIDAALTIVDKPKAYKDKEKLLYYLDAGMLHHYKGNWEKSNELLQMAEDTIEELYTKSLSRAASSVLLNDNSLEYSGEDYEDVYINVFKALNYLNLGDIEAALVEVRRVDYKLSYLEQKHARIAKEMNNNEDVQVEIKSGKFRFHSSALARYLSMALYAATGQYDNARIDYENVLFAFQSQPEIYPFQPPEISQPQRNREAQPLRVVSFVNRAPYKRAREMHIHTSKDLLLIGSVDEDIEVFPIEWKGIEEGYYFKFSIPYLVQRDPRIGRVEAVTSDGKRYRLEKLEDMGLVAQRSFEVKEPMILLKSVTRCILKGLAAQEAKSRANNGSSSVGGSLISLAADAAILFGEKADLRISQFFPAEAYVAEIPLPDDTDSIRIEYFSPEGFLVYAETRDLGQTANASKLISTWCF